MFFYVTLMTIFLAIIVETNLVMICTHIFNHFKPLINPLLLLIFIFIVVCHSENEEKIRSNRASLVNTTISSAAEPLHRTKRSVKRGQNIYFQRGYELNRLRYELENSLRAPRLKPYFHPVNEVYSYYLPTKFNKINANVENFSKFGDSYGNPGNGLYGTRSMRRASAEKHFSVTRRLAPIGTKSIAPVGPTRLAPVSSTRLAPIGPPQPIGVRRVGYPSSSSLARDGYRPQSQGSDDSGYNNPSTGISTGNRQQINDYQTRTGRQSFTRTSLSSSSASSAALVPQPQSAIRNSTYPGIPGWIRSDYPGYHTVPFTGFRCASQPYYGYYADVNAGCQVFHVCQPDGREYSFLCPNGTLYHQKVQTCDWWHHVDCPSSPRYYYLNARIGVLPPIDATLFRFDP